MSAYLAYGLFGLCFLAIAAMPRRLERFQQAASFALLVVIWGGSVQNGTDWIWYETYYGLISQADTLDAALQASPFEAGFVVLMHAIGHAGLPYQVFLGTCALIFAAAWILFLRSLWREANVALLSLLLFLVNGWTLYGEQIRQALALSICLLAFVAWVRRRHVLGFALVLLASLFHGTALFFLWLFLLQQLVYTRPRLAFSAWLVGGQLAAVALFVFGGGVLVESGLLSFLNGTRLYDRYVEYVRSGAYNGAAYSLGMVSYGLGLVVVVLGYRRVAAGRDPLFVFCWLMFLLWCLVGPLLRGQSFLLRLEHYFIPFIVLFLGDLLHAHWPTREGGSGRTGADLLRWGLVTVFVLSFAGRVMMQKNNAVWVESYQNVVLDAAFGLERQGVEARKAAICDNLRRHGNSFCDVRWSGLKPEGD